MNIVVDVQQAGNLQGPPDKDRISEWVKAAIEGLRNEAELTVRIVDEQEGAQLNERWRGGKGATNVLSFPAADEFNLIPELLGDIVICAPVVEKEAREQAKAPEAHWAHMVIHGTLHLLGYDHRDDEEAEIMETLEINRLRKLGYDNPYS
ncbi:MAG: rRNA maturation RNase YbeY [Gammaproteobacteria bacterium]